MTVLVGSRVVEFAHSVGLLVRRVRSAAAAEQLSLTESSVLGRLAKEGPRTTAELARAEAVRPQSMGAAVTTLEAMGLVERTPHPTDGRQVLIGVSAKGAALREQIVEAKTAWLAEAIARLDEKQQATLFAAGEIMKRLVEQ